MLILLFLTEKSLQLKWSRSYETAMMWSWL